LLLIGIQGTPLIRFSTGSNTVELERRRRTLEQKVKEVAREDPDRAAAIIEGAELALPGNAASVKTIERCGGVFEGIRDTKFSPVRRYWIDL
jgi:hypothetical protein